MEIGSTYTMEIVFEWKDDAAFRVWGIGRFLVFKSTLMSFINIHSVVLVIASDISNDLRHFHSEQTL